MGQLQGRPHLHRLTLFPRTSSPFLRHLCILWLITPSVHYGYEFLLSASNAQSGPCKLCSNHFLLPTLPTPPSAHNHPVHPVHPCKPAVARKPLPLACLCQHADRADREKLPACRGCDAGRGEGCAAFSLYLWERLGEGCAAFSLYLWERLGEGCAAFSLYLWERLGEGCAAFSLYLWERLGEGCAAFSLYLWERLGEGCAAICG